MPKRSKGSGGKRGKPRKCRDTEAWLRGKSRRHHNNTGQHTVKRGGTYGQVKAMARRLGVPFGSDQACPAAETPDQSNTTEATMTEKIGTRALLNSTAAIDVLEHAKMRDSTGYLALLGYGWVDKAKVERYLRGSNVKRALDVGCADGTNTIAWAKMFPHIEFVGIDLEQEFIDKANAKAKELGVTNVRFERAWLKDLPERAERFDAVIFCSVLHEFFTYGQGILSVMKALICANEVLNIGGLIIIRDMILSNYTKKASLLLPEIRRKVLAKIDPQVAADVSAEFGAEHPSYSDFSSIFALNHLLLKYMYKSNWERELRENYVAVTIERYRRLFDDIEMDVEVVDSYLLEFLANKWKEDFGLTDEELEVLKSTTWIVAQKNSCKQRVHRYV